MTFAIYDPKKLKIVVLQEQYLSNKPNNKFRKTGV